MTLSYCFLIFVLISTIKAEHEYILFNNFTWLMTPFTGDCKKIPADTLAKDKKLYEGRWYGTQVSFKDKEKKEMTCYYWDSFFDDKGALIDTNYLTVDGKLTISIGRGKPIDASIGLYDNDYNSSDWTNLFTTLYYVDDKLQVRWYIQCIGGGIVYHDMEVGYRDLKDIKEKAEKVEELAKKLEASFGKFDKFQIPYENCKK